MAEILVLIGHNIPHSVGGFKRPVDALLIVFTVTNINIEFTYSFKFFGFIQILFHFFHVNRFSCFKVLVSLQVISRNLEYSV